MLLVPNSRHYVVIRSMIDKGWALVKGGKGAIPLLPRWSFVSCATFGNQLTCVTFGGPKVATWYQVATYVIFLSQTSLLCWFFVRYLLATTLFFFFLCYHLSLSETAHCWCVLIGWLSVLWFHVLMEWLRQSVMIWCIWRRVFDATLFDDTKMNLDLDLDLRS